MQTLAIIQERDIFPFSKFPDREEYTKRLTVKAIVKNAEGHIALVASESNHIYTLPGGGAESDDLLEELSRECVEEIHATIKNIKELGQTEEYRNRESKEYITMCFTADFDQHTHDDLRTDKEKENRLYVKWFSPSDVKNIFDDQLERLKRGEFRFYNTSFNIYRDRIFLEYYFSQE